MNIGGLSVFGDSRSDFGENKTKLFKKNLGITVEKFKYYLVPLWESDIKIDGVSMWEILCEYFPKFADMETERKSIIYRYSDYKEQLKSHVEFTKSEYDKENIPYYLIVKGNENCAYELINEKCVIPDYPAALGVFEESKEEVAAYYYDSNYYEKINKYMKIITNKNKTANMDINDSFSTVENYKSKFTLILENNIIDGTVKVRKK